MHEPHFYAEREARLVALARLRFDQQLSEPELKVLQDSVRPGPAPAPKSPDGKDASPKGRIVRPALLRWIAVDTEASSLLDPNGLSVTHATLDDELDLAEMRMAYDLNFLNCIFRGNLGLNAATVHSLVVNDCSILAGMDASRLTCKTDVDLSDCDFGGSLRFDGMTVGQNVLLSGSTVRAFHDERIGFDGSSIAGDLRLFSLTCSRPISVISARIGGNLDLSGAYLKAPDPKTRKSYTALFLDVSDIRGMVLLNPQQVDADTSVPFRCEGDVHAPHLHIGQDIYASSAVFSKPGGTLMFEALDVRSGGVFFDNMKCSCKVDLAFAVIGVFVLLSYSNIDFPGTAVDLEGASIAEGVNLMGLVSSGGVQMVNGKVDGDWKCHGVKMQFLEIKRTNVNGDLYWVGIQNAHNTPLDLEGSRLRVLYDDPDSWPGILMVLGLTYENLQLCKPPKPLQLDGEQDLEELPLSAEDRVKWLHRQESGSILYKQPWLQLAALLQASGDDQGAKDVAFAYSQLKADPQGRIVRDGKVFSAWVKDNTLRISYPIAGLWLLGTVVFWRARRMRAMAPTDERAFEFFMKNEPLPGYVPFHPVVYTLENVLPVVKFGQDNAWAPNPASRSTALGWRRWLPGTTYPWLALLRWVLITFGWLLALILVDAIAGHFKD